MKASREFHCKTPFGHKKNVSHFDARNSRNLSICKNLQAHFRTKQNEPKKGRIFGSLPSMQKFEFIEDGSMKSHAFEKKFFFWMHVQRDVVLKRHHLFFVAFASIFLTLILNKLCLKYCVTVNCQMLFQNIFSNDLKWRWKQWSFQIVYTRGYATTPPQWIKNNNLRARPGQAS